MNIVFDTWHLLCVLDVGGNAESNQQITKSKPLSVREKRRRKKQSLNQMQLKIHKREGNYDINSRKMFIKRPAFVEETEQENELK